MLPPAGYLKNYRTMEGSKPVKKLKCCKIFIQKAYIQELKMHILTYVNRYVQIHKVGKQCASVAAMPLCTLCAYMKMSLRMYLFMV